MNKDFEKFDKTVRELLEIPHSENQSQIGRGKGRTGGPD